MSCEQYAVQVQGAGKCYQLYARPADRLKQFILPRLRTLLELPAKCYYREFWALRDVGFTIQRGEQVGIVGRNGAGKSTLLQMICGTLAATEGSIAVQGRVAALLELGAGFNPELSGKENVFLNGAVLGLTHAQILERYEAILAFADIGEFIHQPVKNYSSGMYMRLAFAVAAHVDPDVLVVDEALSVGDEAFQRKCNLKIQALRDAGATVLFVSHSASQVIEMCSRALLIDKGRLLADGEPKHVIAEYHRNVLAAARTPAPIKRESAASPAPMGAEVVAELVVANAPDDDAAFFDPNLQATTTAVYPTQGCEISQLRLLTPSGRQVNVLTAGKEYLYAYTVRFSEAAAAVRFGMMIRTLRGLDLGGGVSTPASTPHAYFAADTTLEVRFRFRTTMEAGVYFLNAGVVSVLGEEEKYLARIVDALMFRVLPSKDTVATGMVNFDIAPSMAVAHREG